MAQYLYSIPLVEPVGKFQTMNRAADARMQEAGKRAQYELDRDRPKVNKNNPYLTSRQRESLLRLQRAILSRINY